MKKLQFLLSAVLCLVCSLSQAKTTEEKYNELCVKGNRHESAWRVNWCWENDKYYKKDNTKTQIDKLLDQKFMYFLTFYTEFGLYLYNIDFSKTNLSGTEPTYPGAHFYITRSTKLGYYTILEDGKYYFEYKINGQSIRTDITKDLLTLITINGLDLDITSDFYSVQDLVKSANLLKKEDSPSLPGREELNAVCDKVSKSKDKTTVSWIKHNEMCERIKENHITN